MSTHGGNAIIRFDACMGDVEHQMRGQVEIRDGHIFSFLATGEPIASTLTSAPPTRTSRAPMQRGHRYGMDIGGHVTRAFALPGVGIIMQFRPPNSKHATAAGPPPRREEVQPQAQHEAIASAPSSPDTHLRQQRTPTSMTTRSGLRSRRGTAMTTTNATRAPRSTTPVGEAAQSRSRSRRQVTEEDTRLWRRATPTAHKASPLAPHHIDEAPVEADCHWFTLQHPLDEPQPVLSCAPSTHPLPTNYYTPPGEPKEMSFDRHPQDMLVGTSDDPAFPLLMTYNAVTHTHTVWEWGPLRGMDNADVVTQMIDEEGWEFAMGFISTQESRLVARPILSEGLPTLVKSLASFSSVQASLSTQT